MHVPPLRLYMCHIWNIIYILLYLSIIRFSENYHSVLMPLYGIVVSSGISCCFVVTYMFKNRNEFI